MIPPIRVLLTFALAAITVLVLDALGLVKEGSHGVSLTFFYITYGLSTIYSELYELKQKPKESGK